MLPNVIRDQVVLLERPITSTSRKRKRHEAQIYSRTNHFQPKFDKMRINSVCLFLAPTVTERTDHMCFRINLGKGELSPLVYMAVIDGMDLHAKTVTWVYLGPRTAKFCNPKERVMATENASKCPTWVLQTEQEHRQTAKWVEEEMVLSWDRNEGERGWSLPKEQYKQAQTVLLSMAEQRDHDEESSDEDE